MQGLLVERALERDSLFYTTNAGRWFLNRGTSGEGRGTRGQTIMPRCPPRNPSLAQPRRTVPDPDDHTPALLTLWTLVPPPSSLVYRIPSGGGRRRMTRTSAWTDRAWSSRSDHRRSGAPVSGREWG